MKGITIGDPVVISTVITTSSPVTVNTIKNKDPVPVNVGSGSGLSNTSLWTGEGPPHLVIGASVGDEYLDTITGILYRLNEGI